MRTLHGIAADDWQSLPAGADYRPASLAEEGFIHTTIGPADFAAALNRHNRADLRPYVALVIELDRVSACWEIVQYPNLPGEYPHIHGPLNLDAVVGVAAVPRDESGGFLPPAL